ncbi:phosphoenolpyruvate synthase, partial [Candidatus Gottesmanbacteria bacterium]|nr:phosphoenolpyruvate synthase [Candidatus Gottesmanbacteria bacterium]
KNHLSLLDVNDPENLQQTSEAIQKIIKNAPIPKDIAHKIMLAYLDLSFRAKKNRSLADRLTSVLKQPVVAVRSSATAEDLPNASFAGQQATFLNIAGETNVVHKVIQAWASLFTPRAIFYRTEQKFDHLKVGIAVPVQLMVASEVSGVMFTIDPVTNNKSKIIIEAIYGLGELLVGGQLTPDHYEVDKKTLEISARKIVQQPKMLVRKGGMNKEVTVESNKAAKAKINDAQIQEIAQLGKKLEKHYFFPQDIEWAIENNCIYIVQTRPITTIKSQKSKVKSQNEEISTTDKLNILVKGDPASPGIAWGPAKILFSVRELHKIIKGDVLVATQTNPDFVPAMKKAVAIVTERGGRTSHAAIVSRELGIPAVVGALDATKLLPRDQIITVNGTKGEIYQGAYQVKSNSKYPLLDSHGKQISKEKDSHVNKFLKTATKVYVNLAMPDRAKEVAKMNVDGIGLLRAEFMIANIGIHPKQLIKSGNEKMFITKLAADILKFCDAFYPRPVVYRATDFKTNEYRNLTGGKEFEPQEPNPMLGYRGVFRYISDPKVFELELEAIKIIRNNHGYKNLWLMLPFVRTVKELKAVKSIISAAGLLESSSFKLWMMVEIPSNVIILDQFLELGIDGVSIGSNDLTMLILGTDRDNTEVASEYDERNPAVLWAIEKVIKTCHKYKVTSSVCGQAPSDYPELVEKLVDWGITSVSVDPDAVDNVRETIFHAEHLRVKKS